MSKLTNRPSIGVEESFKTNKNIEAALDFIASTSPVVKSNIEGIRDLVQQAVLEGENKIDSKQISQKFPDLNKEDREKLGEGAQKTLAVIPEEKTGFKGKFPAVIHKLETVKIVFENIGGFIKGTKTKADAAKGINGAGEEAKKSMEEKSQNVVPRAPVQYPSKARNSGMRI